MRVKGKKKEHEFFEGELYLQQYTSEEIYMYLHLSQQPPETFRDRKMRAKR
jgi:hypothetical protein